MEVAIQDGLWRVCALCLTDRLQTPPLQGSALQPRGEISGATASSPRRVWGSVGGAGRPQRESGLSHDASLSSLGVVLIRAEERFKPSPGGSEVRGGRRSGAGPAVRAGQQPL